MSADTKESGGRKARRKVRRCRKCDRVIKPTGKRGHPPVLCPACRLPASKPKVVGTKVKVDCPRCQKKAVIVWMQDEPVLILEGYCKHCNLVMWTERSTILDSDSLVVSS